MLGGLVLLGWAVRGWWLVGPGGFHERVCGGFVSGGLGNRWKGGRGVREVEIARWMGSVKEWLLVLVLATE